MRDNRRKEMASFIARRQSVTMSELCSEFHVSINTIRADVAALAKSGIVEKIYGGVRSAMKQDVPVFTQRTRLRPDAKLDISRTAVGMIKNGDTLFSIACSYGDVRPEDIAVKNQLVLGDPLPVGLTIAIP